MQSKFQNKNGSVKIVLIIILCIFLAVVLLGLGLWYLISFKNAGVIIPVPPTVKEVAPSLEQKRIEIINSGSKNTSSSTIKSSQKTNTQNPGIKTASSTPIKPI